MSTDWRPSCTHEILQSRSKIIHQIREFFISRGVLEVETMILSKTTVSSPYIDSFVTYSAHDKQKYFLNTSPEYQMKRLIAAGSGPIFQIGKVFRNEPRGNHHHPEFTMLEWYQPGYDLQRLLDEVEDLLNLILDTKVMDRFTYKFVMNKFAKIDPIKISYSELVNLCTEKGLVNAETMNRDSLLEYIFACEVEPNIGQENPVAIYDYPASQAALATLGEVDSEVANRAEVYYKSIELGNGYQELTDREEQYSRFLEDNLLRKQLNKEEIPMDHYLLDSLPHMPRCSGIAIGLDRLIMLALGRSSIEEVSAFCIENA